MSNDNSPSACLVVLRNALIQRRRQTAKAAWDAQGDRVVGLAADLGVKLKSIQDAIDAVDRAILDEEAVAAAASAVSADSEQATEL